MSTVLEPCFNLEFVEESADQSGTSTNGFSLDNTNIYRRKSIWDKPDSNHYNSSANSLKISLTMRNLASENQLFHYILQNFPMKVHVYSKYRLRYRVFVLSLFVSSAKKIFLDFEATSDIEK
jgi:hypothetical protein